MAEPAHLMVVQAAIAGIGAGRHVGALVEEAGGGDRRLVSLRRVLGGNGG